MLHLTQSQSEPTLMLIIKQKEYISFDIWALFLANYIYVLRNFKTGFQNNPECEMVIFVANKDRSYE